MRSIRNPDSTGGVLPYLLALIPLILALAWGHIYADEAYGYFQDARALAAGRATPFTAAPLYILLLALTCRLGLPLPQTALLLSTLGWVVAVTAWLRVGREMARPALGLIMALFLALHPLQGRTLGFETGPALGLVGISLLVSMRTEAKWSMPVLAVLTILLLSIQPTMAPWALLLWTGWGGWSRTQPHPSCPSPAHLVAGAALLVGLLALETTLTGTWSDVRLLVPLSVAVQILLAAGLAIALTRTVRPLALLAIVAICIGQASLLIQEWSLRPGDRLALCERIARWVRAYTLPTDLIGAPFPGLLGFLSERPTLALPGDRPVDELLTLLESRRPDFCIAPSSLPWQLLRLQPWFQEHYRLVAQDLNPYDPASTLQVYQYVPSPFDTSEAITSSLTFMPAPGQHLELTAYRLDSQRLVSGQPLYLSLYWRATTSLDQPLRLTLYLTPETGGPSRRWTETTAPGGLPTNLWSPGTMVVDRHQLFPPPDLPAGRYHLALVMHLPNGQPVSPCCEAQSGEGSPTPIASLYRPAAVSTEIPLPDYPVHLTFGSGIELVGYDAPEWIISGTSFRVALYWHAVQPISANYKIFVHLLAGDHSLLAQSDSEPVNWTYPTSRWQTGEYIMDEHWLTLPPDTPRGDVWLSVGLYDPATGQRLPAYDGRGVRMSEDRAVLQKIRVYGQ